MTLSELEYEILNECKCGIEQFFVLATGLEDKEIPALLQALCRLIGLELLEWARGTSNMTQRKLTLSELQQYIATRQHAGEPLDEYPEVCEEYDFHTTRKGIELLREEDKPITLEEWQKETDK